MNLLITDDEVISVKGIISGVNWEKCKINEVFVAYSAEQAISIFKENEIDILLCDIEMPQDNGLSLLAWIRNNYPLVECSFLSCHADFKFAREALQLGSFDYLVKPVPYEDIENLIIKMKAKVDDRKRKTKLLDYGEIWFNALAQEVKQDLDKGKSSAELIKELEQYIMAHIGDNTLSVERLAQMVYLSTDHLIRLFKKEKAISPMKYIIRERMELAARLLVETNAPAQKIALEVGYINYPQFVSMFKKLYGVSPSHYKKAKEN
ncbi:response regulator transcription factor [Neobacillus niacini]|uniref:response regulator transcription factor n=1 Tax=Neobacillus niacini TaxID=86668 RepID=UPI002FFF756F